MFVLSNKQKTGILRSLLAGFVATTVAVDLYCGAGGASAGLYRASSELEMPAPELVAINHWDTAIATHQANFPDQVHILSSVERVDPRETVYQWLTASSFGIVDFVLAGPSCTHYSRARGGKPTTEQQRSGAWEIIKWCREVVVRHLLVENVPEFLTWGPLRQKRHKKTNDLMFDPKTNEPLMEPDPAQKGRYFHQWVRMLKAMGYRVEWKILCSADYGDATTRKRLFIQARMDGQPIVFPTPTHQAPEKKQGKVHQTSLSFEATGDSVNAVHPWKTAREVIDWNTPSESIFTRKRPLAWKTLLRIAAGLLKFWGIEMDHESLYPYSKEGTKEGRVRGPVKATMVRPLEITAALKEKQGFTIGQQSCAAPRSTDEPIATVSAAGAISVVTPFLAQFTQASNKNAIYEIDAPIPTITTKTEHGIVTAELVPSDSAFIVPNNSSSPPASIERPIHTITTNARGIGVAEPHLIVLRHSGGKSGMAAPRSINEPIPTLCASGQHIALTEPVISSTPYITRFNGGRDFDQRTESIDRPLSTLDTSNRLGFVQPVLLGVGGPQGKQAPASVDEPLRTLIGENHTGVAEAVIASAPCVVSYHGNDDAHGIDEPLRTIRGRDRFGLLEADAATSGGQVFYLLDVRFRMLQWRELAKAHSFITDEHDYKFTGNQEARVKQVGNSWTVNLATALCKSVLQQLRGDKVVYA